MCPSSFYLFFFSFCLKDTAFQEPFFFCVLAHALSESLMHVCVCVCVCVSMAAKSEQQQRPPPKKSETWLPSAPQNAKDAVDAFLSPPRFFFLPPFFLLSFLFLRWFVAIFSAQKKKKKKEANVDDDDDDEKKKKNDSGTFPALFAHGCCSVEERQLGAASKSEQDVEEKRKQSKSELLSL